MTDYKPDIWQLQAQVDIEGLVEALREDDADIRKRAAAALRSMGAREAVPALKQAYANEQDEDTKSTLLLALQTLSDDLPEGLSSPDTALSAASQQQHRVQRLIDQLKSDDPDDIIDAAKALGELGDKLAVEPLVLLFNDARMSIQVRHAVAEALLKLESAPVEVALLANLRHKEWQIRRNGAAILGQLEAEWAIQPLAQALNDPHKNVQRTARAALKKIGTPEARKALARNGPHKSHRKPMQPRTPDGKKKEVAPPPLTSPSNGLLRFIEQDDDNDDAKPDHRRSKRSTEPLDETVEGEKSPDAKRLDTPRHYEPTQPIDNDVLNDVLSELDDENDPDSPENE